MYNNFSDEQYKINKWCQFVDQKITQFFNKHLQKHNIIKDYYYNFINALSIIIIRFILKTNDNKLLVFCLILVIMHLLLSIKKKFSKVLNFLNHIIDVFVLISIQNFSRENDNEFIIGLVLQIAIQTSKSMLFQYDQFSMIFQNILKISLITIIKWYLIKDYNTQKIIILMTFMIFYQLIQFLIVTSYSYGYKNIWINNERMKKNNQMIEKLLYEIPIGIILFNSNGEVQFQNSNSYKYLPKSIDSVTKKYSDLILIQEDKPKFQKIFGETLESIDPIVVSFVFQGNPIPIYCHMRKQIFNMNQIVEVIFIEKSDNKSLIYEKIQQNQQILKIQQISEILSKQPKRIKYQLLQSLFNNSDYQKSNQIVCNIRNYFKFFADCIQIIYKITLNLRIENEVPDQVFIDIVRLHSILTQLISYIYQEHHRKSMMQGVSSQGQLIQQGEMQFQRELNNFSLISFTISKGNELQMTIQIDYHHQIKELEMLFKKFDFEGLKSQEFRLQQLQKEEDLQYIQFIYILHQIYQMEGRIELWERLDNIKIQINIPIRLSNEDQNILLNKYISMGKFDIESKIYSIELFQDFRIKSSKNIVSTQRIAPQIQSSLNEQKQFQICKCFEFTYRHNVISEEEKLESRKIISPDLSPINKPLPLNQTDVATFDIEDRINTQMHSVEKAVSKVLEQVLSEIMTYKGKKINVQFRNSQQKQRSFETSPSNSSAQRFQNQRNTSVPHLQQFRTTIPEQRKINNNLQQLSQPPNQSLFKQIAIKQLPTQTSQNFGVGSASQSSTSNLQQINSIQQIKRQQGTQLLKNLRVNDSKVQQLEQNDLFNQFKPDENNDDQKNSMKLINSAQEDHQLQKSLTSFGVIVQPIQTQGSEKSPSFQMQKQVTINEIENQSEEIKKQETVDLQSYYKDILTYLIVDDSKDLVDLQIKLKHQFDRSLMCSDATIKIKSMFEQNKIYHFIIVKINLPIQNGIQFIQEIRKLEIEYNFPNQYFIGVDTNISQTLKQSCLYAGFDDVQEKPLNSQYLDQLITNRMNPSPVMIWKPIIAKTCSITQQQEKLNQVQQDIDQFSLPKQISSLIEIPIIQPQFRKAFYHPIVTIYLLDDSSVQINALLSMKFNFQVKIEYDRIVDAGFKRLDKLFQEKKIYHVILVKMNFTQKNGLEILQSIRELEEKYQVPKQFIVAIDSDFTEEKKIDLIKEGFDDALTKLIDKRLLEGILQKRLQDD